MKTAKIMNFTKIAKFAIIVSTTNEIYEIYSRGIKEGPSKFMKTVKITQFTKIAKFAIFRQDHQRNLQNLFKG